MLALLASASMRLFVEVSDTVDERDRSSAGSRGRGLGTGRGETPISAAVVSKVGV